MRKLRIVHFIDNLGIGGTELNAVRTLERLDRRVYEPRLLVLQATGALRSRVDALGLPVSEVRIGGSLYSPRTFWGVWRLSLDLRRWKVDVVHCHDRYTNLVGTLAARLARVPVAVASKRWTETTWAHRIVSMVAFRLAHRVVVNGDGVAQSAMARERVPAGRLTVIPNFLDDDAFDAPPPGWVQARRRGLGIPEGVPVIGVVASLRPVKGHLTIIRALPTIAAAVPGTRLVFVGTGPQREDLEREANKLGIGDLVVFAGAAPQQPSFHWVFDVSLLASRSEGFPNSLIEAMAAARPVVASNVAGNREAVVDGVTGDLFPWGDAPALSAALVRQLQTPERRQRMGLAGRERAWGRFRSAQALAALDALYRPGVHG